MADIIVIFALLAICVTAIGVPVYQLLRSLIRGRKHGRLEAEEGEESIWRICTSRDALPPATPLLSSDQIPQEVVEWVSYQINKEFKNVEPKLGLCHTIEARKKQLYREFGYEWLSPLETDPFMTYD